MTSSDMTSSIRNVGEVLQDALTIPIYQRPYRWSEKHVSQLIHDIIHHQDKSSYRLGTIVVHEDEDSKLSIVDGQQRLLTLALMVVALQKILPDSDVFKDSKSHTSFLQSLTISNVTSITNLKHNSVIIKQRLESLKNDTDNHAVLEKLAHYLLNHCTVVFITLTDLSEAFQFFDSQNARGKPLEPYDLLKAYHLREMKHESSLIQTSIIQSWEEHAKAEGSLKEIFDDFLFRIKKWLKHEQGRYFSKDDIDLFKGLNPDEKDLPPYFSLYKISHHLTDNYNQEGMRKIDNQHLNYPFAINQIVLNGRRFFESVDHYIKVLKVLESHCELQHIFKLIGDTDGKNRKGDQYTLNLFKCVLMFYFDKFGDYQLKQAGDLCFLWAYRLRLDKQSLQMASMDNYAKKANSLFFIIHHAIQAKEVLNFIISPLEKCNATKMGKIEKIFTDKGLLKNDN